MKTGLPVIVDNTFATPYLFRPLDHGADVVVHSATKFIGGHGTTLGGSSLKTANSTGLHRPLPRLRFARSVLQRVNFAKDIPGAGFVTRIRAKALRDLGACISPFNAWLLIQGLESLSLRIERHVENAQKIADFLENSPKVAKVNYPSLPSSPYYKLAQKYFPKGTAPSSPLNSKTATRLPANSSTAPISSRIWPTSATPSRSSFTPLRRPTSSFLKKPSAPAASRRARSASPSASKTSKTS